VGKHLWINYEFLGNGSVLQWIIGICFFVTLSVDAKSRGGDRKVFNMTRDQLRRLSDADWEAFKR